MYENTRVRRRLLILHLIIRCAQWSEKYGTGGIAIGRQPRLMVNL